MAEQSPILLAISIGFCPVVYPLPPIVAE